MRRVCIAANHLTIYRLALCEVAVRLASEKVIPVSSNDTLYVAVANIEEQPLRHVGGLQEVILFLGEIWLQVAVGVRPRPILIALIAPRPSLGPC